jgi:cytochrome c556
MRTRVMVQVSVVAASLVALAAVGCASMQQPKMSAAEAIDARQKLMKEQGAAWKNVQDKTKAGQITAIVPDAEKLMSTSKEIPTLFPEGSLNPEKSNAKPEIWQKRDQFDAAAKNLETWSAKLRDAAAANNAEQTQAIVKDFGRQACGTCHQPFRVPPKQQ